MKRDAFTITDLTIGRMPGLHRGLKPYEELSPNINIIAGPNASGKSSTARAIQKLIWREDTGGLLIDGRAQYDGEPWSVRIDSNNVSVQRSGKEDELHSIPAPEDKSRYMLALHKLVKADEGELARQIIRESIGGYDLEEAAGQLGYSSTIRNRRITEYKEYRKARKEVAEQQKRQKEIKKEEARLADLHKQREEAKRAARLAELYKAVIEYFTQKLEYEERRKEFKAFPPVLKKAHGDEVKQIENLEEEIAGARQAVRKAEEEIAGYEKQLEALDIPSGGVDSADLFELEERIEKLRKLEEDITQCESEIARCEEKKREALNRIDPLLDTTEWEGLDLDAVEHLDRFFDAAHRVGSRKHYYDCVIEELREQEAEDVTPQTELKKGIEALTQWLQEPRKISGFPEWITKTILAVGALAIVGAFLWWPVGVLGLALICGLTLYGLWNSEQSVDNHAMAIRQKDYAETVLSPPARWEAEAVGEKLRELVDALQETRWQEHIRGELDRWGDKLDDIQAQLEKIEEEGDELRERLSTLPELPLEDPQQYNALYWFIVHVREWQQANREVEAFRKKKESYGKKYKEELANCAEIVEKYNIGTVTDTADTVARYKKLAKQEEDREDAGKGISRQQKIIREKREVTEGKEELLEEIYEKLEVNTGNKDEVQILVNQLEDFGRAKEKHQVCRRMLSRKQTEMEEHGLYEGQQAQIAAMDKAEAKEKHRVYKDRAGELDNINNEIHKINGQVEAITQNNTLEKAISQRDEALLELQQEYEKNVSSVTGSVLVDCLKEQVREQNRPEVFHEANALFSRITKGRYELEIDEKDHPQFIAYDTIEQTGRSLQELSTGTRIQLLLSVRIAFVKAQESAVKLPILADELLANSDDLRAQAIIEALTEISREGRQIFYFTAQADEVAKWQAYLTEAGIDFKVCMVEDGREEQIVPFEADIISSFELLHEVPELNGYTYEEYARQVDVEPFDLIQHEVSQIHLWYLLEDAGVLQQCLRQGIDRWGTLKSFHEHGGVIDGLAPGEIDRLDLKVQALAHFQRLYRRGRPKPINRAVLEDTSAVTGNFIDEVAAKLDELEGNPVKLLAALEAGEVSGFRRNKIKELEAYLTEKGFIDTYAPMDAEAINSRLQAFVSTKDLSVQEVNKVIGRVTEGVEI